MEKRPAILLSLLITILVASNFYFINIIKSEQKKETVIIARVIDGDTLKLADNRTVRLLNVNAPEKDSISAIPAYEYLKNFENKKIEIQPTKKDKYNRLLARLYLKNKSYLNLELVKNGFSSKFLVESSELKLFSQAEKKAIEEENGIWKKSQYFDCISIDVEKTDEIVTISNNCAKINILGWMVKDESRKTYFFPKVLIGKIKLHSTSGRDNLTDLYWNSKDPIWNDDRDSLYLFDSKGKIAGYLSYGY